MSKAFWQHLPNLISLSAVIILGFLIAKMTLLLVHKQSPMPVIASVTSAPELRETLLDRPRYAQSVVKHHLMGEIQEVKVEPKVTPKKVLKTRLKLSLHGTIAYRDQTGFAMIATQGKTQKTYAVGETLEGHDNIRLKRVYASYIVLNREGKEEELHLPKKDDKSKTSHATTTPPSGSPAPNFQFGGRPDDKPKPTAVSQNTRQNTRIDPNQLSNIRDQLMTNPAQLTKIMRVSPVSYNGEFQGFKVTPGSQRKAFTALGFKAGDIVRSVNGTVIDAPEKGMEILQTLATSDVVNIVVKRGKNEVTLNGVF